MNPSIRHASSAEQEPGLDLAATAVRAFVLYALAEFQLGGAKTIRVSLQGREFGISDDGRGHPLDKTLEGSSYLRFIYTHFEYPFDGGRSAPVQLQGIGMSLVNTMCARLTLTVRKPDETLTMVCTHGRIQHRQRTPGTNAQTGITISARLREDLPAPDAPEASLAGLQAWLAGLVQAHPGLRLFLNEHPVQAPGGD